MTVDASIVLPTLNEEGNVGDCLDSVEEGIRESDRSFEVIVVDSHSTDGTVEVVRGHPLETEVITTETGILNARDTGVQAAEGDVVFSLDADSKYDDRFFDDLLEPFERENGVVMTYGAVHGETAVNIDAALRLALQFGLWSVGLHWASGSSRAFDREAYHRAGGFRLDRDGKSLFSVMYEEQYRFPLRLSAEGTVRFVSDARSWQEARTMKQLLLLERKSGGRDWKLISHYDAISEIEDRLSEPFTRSSAGPSHR